MARLHVVEFQKRGPPHAHILLILAPRTCEDVDLIVSAELPDPATHPRLFAIVTTCMLHGPCGGVNPNMACMEGNHCTKDFPKHFQERTVMNPDGFPTYRRRDNGRTFTRRVAAHVDT